MGKAVPVRISRHTHPKARPEAAPHPTPTGIDYAGLTRPSSEEGLTEMEGPDDEQGEQR